MYLKSALKGIFFIINVFKSRSQVHTYYVSYNEHPLATYYGKIKKGVDITKS